MNIRPALNRVLVKMIEKKQSSGGIIIPDNVARERAVPAEVIAVGPGKLKEDGTYRRIMYDKGENVLVNRFKGITVQFDDNNDDYILLEDEDIIGTIDA